MGKKNVLVTGGAGFIGSHLVDRLLRDGHRVTVLDNFSTGRRENITQHKGNKRLRIVKCDISLTSVTGYFEVGNEMWDPEVGGLDFLKPNHQDIKKSHIKDKSVSLLTSKHLHHIFQGIDWVFHLAALADIVPSIVHPAVYHKVNVDGTVQVLEAARKAKVKRFLYAASSSCYGLPITLPTPETAPIQPQYPYALTKYIGEQYVVHWGKVYGLPVVSLRLFNVYGPRSRTSGTYGAVFGVFLAQKLAGKPFTVVGDGEQTRDFTFVSDVVDAFVKAAESDVRNEIFNVGSGKPSSINTIVKLLKGNVVQIPKRPGEPDVTHADTKKIQTLLGWKPMVSFEKGVRMLLQNISYWNNAPVWTPQTIEKATREWFAYLQP